MARKRSGKGVVNVPGTGASEVGSFSGRRPGSSSRAKGPIASPGGNRVSSNMPGMAPGPIGGFRGSRKPPGNSKFKSLSG